MIAWLIVIILVCVCVSLWRKKYDEEIDLEKRKAEAARLDKEIEDKISWKGHLDNDCQIKLNQIQAAEETLNNAHEQRVRTLEHQYNIEKQKIDDELAELKEIHNENVAAINEELEVLKSTRNAAIESWRKEEEIKANQDFYRLNISNNDKKDISLLEDIKPSFSNPRIISKLIWQTYYQPLAKKKFPMILGEAKTGIYKITNLKNNMCYIGQAVDLYKRMCQHCQKGCDLDRPAGNKLYAAMVEDGLWNFTFEVLEECDKEYLTKKEGYFIELYQSVSYGYNSRNENK